MNARVVLPSPGGPEKRIWFNGSPRFFAAPTITCRRSTVFSWPVKSAKLSGRSAASAGETGAERAVLIKPNPLLESEGDGGIFDFRISIGSEQQIRLGYCQKSKFENRNSKMPL